jgi:hypothetical protein
MFRLLTFVSFLTISSASVTQFLMKSCGKSDDLAQNIILNVEPVLPQSDYTLFLDADLSQIVNQGTSKYSVTYNFIPLSPTTEDLCTEIAKSNITCPLNNTIASESKGTVPKGLSGTVVIKNEWFDVSNARILCMQFTIKISGLTNTTNTSY